MLLVLSIGLTIEPEIFEKNNEGEFFMFLKYFFFKILFFIFLNNFILFQNIFNKQIPPYNLFGKHL